MNSVELQEPAARPHSLKPESPPESPLPGPRQRGATPLEGYVLRRLLRGVGSPPLTVVLWDGQEFPPDKGSPVARVHVRTRRALWRVGLDPLYQFGEMYAAGELEVEGDFTEALREVFSCFNRASPGVSLASRLHRWFLRPRRNTLHGSRENVHHHYDIGNDFYRKWLDRQLVYTCAYFPHRDCTLEEAQIAKLDHVARKLRLQPGDTVFEAGCGWGALALHLARHYGVHVRAFNISHQQILFARQRAADEGLADRVEFVEDDWRSIQGKCDAFVSVGMLEHVGTDHYAELGHVIDRCLKPGGLGLIHTIGQNQRWPTNPWIERRIFPGGYAPTLRECMEIFEPHALSVLDVENIRLHYALTLRHWRDRYEQSVPWVREQFGEKFVRIWRMYLCGSIAAFESGSLQLFQIVFARGANNNIPWTRADLYAPQNGPPERSNPNT